MSSPFHRGRNGRLERWWNSPNVTARWGWAGIDWLISLQYPPPDCFPSFIHLWMDCQELLLRGRSFIRLDWPKSSFRFFYNILWKNQKEVFGQPSPNTWDTLYCCPPNLQRCQLRAVAELSSVLFWPPCAGHLNSLSYSLLISKVGRSGSAWLMEK